MKVKDIIKKQTTLIAIAVAIVVVASLGVSYAIFFNVSKNTENQVITAGTLRLAITKSNALTSIPTSGGLTSAPLSYTVSNDGNLPASYSIYVYPKSDNAVQLNKIKISTDGNSSSGSTSKLISSITKTTVDGKDCYLIDSGTLGKKGEANASASTKYIRIWADEDNLADTDDGGKVSLGLYIVSEVQE